MKKQNFLKTMHLQEKSLTDNIVAIVSIIVGIWFLIDPINAGIIFVQIISFFIFLGGSFILYLYFKNPKDSRNPLLLIGAIILLSIGLSFFLLPFFIARAFVIFIGLLFLILQFDKIISFVSLNLFKKITTALFSAMSLVLIFFPSIGIGLAGYLAGVTFVAIGLEKVISYFR